MLAFAPVANETYVMSSNGPPAKRKRSQDVRAHLFQLIDRGSLRPGDPLPSERELMDGLTVGRPAIREAMQSLERAGLIIIRHGGRARVAEPSIGRMFGQVSDGMRHILMHSPISLENLKDARVTFEAEMARIAARRHSTQDIERLQHVMMEQQKAVADPARFRLLDGRFHRDIAGISGNPIWTALSEALFGWLSDFHVDLVAVPGLEDLTLDEHRQIVAAIATGHPDKAATAMTNHLIRANALYRRPLGQPD
jgi:GntR family transcriptional regulator, sialic acid-inducible nan operon repressor